MSNLLPSPEAEECHSAVSSSSIEALPERKTHIGSLEVHRVLPVRGRRLIGPWCFFDRYGPLTFGEEKPMDVAPHPHIGLQTVTWLISGEVVHHDSLGSECLVRPGQLSLMTAGRGIAHTEETPLDNSRKLDGAQLWVALPNESRSIAPTYQCTKEQPTADLPGGRATVIVGDFAAASSAGQIFSPGMGADIEVFPRSKTTLPLTPTFEYGLLLMSGDAAAERTALQQDTLYYLGTQRHEIELASQSGARLILIGGLPFQETILMWWNFVARTQEEIATARQLWEGHELFGDVPKYRGPRLSAPAFVGRPIPNR